MSDNRDEPQRLVWECRVCGNENEVGSARCRNCWANRADEVERPVGGRRSRRRRYFGWWRTLRWAVALFVFTAFMVWYLLPRLGVASFLRVAGIGHKLGACIWRLADVPARPHTQRIGSGQFGGSDRRAEVEGGHGSSDICVARRGGAGSYI